MRGWPIVAMVVGAAVLTACTLPTHISSVGYLPVAACPVTHGVPGARAPASLDYQPPPVSYVHDWYGNEVIWAMLPIRGRLPALSDPVAGWPGRLSTKFPWYGLRSGQIRVTGQRLDGPGRFAADIGTVQQGYGPPGFVPSDLHWSGPGCWRITATLDGSTLRIIARVNRP